MLVAITSSSNSFPAFFSSNVLHQNSMRSYRRWVYSHSREDRRESQTSPFRVLNCRARAGCRQLEPECLLCHRIHETPHPYFFPARLAPNFLMTFSFSSVLAPIPRKLIHPFIRAAGIDQPARLKTSLARRDNRVDGLLQQRRRISISFTGSVLVQTPRAIS